MRHCVSLISVFPGYVEGSYWRTSFVDAFLTISCFSNGSSVVFAFRETSFLFLSDIPVLYLRLWWGFVRLSRRDLFTLVASGDISPSRVSPDFSGTCRLFCRNKGAFFCHCRDLFFSIVFLRLRHPLFGLPALYPFISGL
jgi:hypothetical protein